MQIKQPSEHDLCDNKLCQCPSPILTHFSTPFLAEPPAGAGQRHHQLRAARGLHQDRARRHRAQAGRRRLPAATRQPGTYEICFGLGLYILLE